MSLAPINNLDSQLAVELATEISPIKDILSRHSMTTDGLRKKMEDPRFIGMIREAKRVWGSDLGAKERIRVKSAVLIEDALLELNNIFHDKELAAPARLEAFKSLAKVADVYEQPRNGAAVGERVSININIPGVEKPIVFEGTAQPVLEGEVA